ncbi:MAG: HD domain-containing protein [Candidatus Altimarinota bacterium]
MDISELIKEAKKHHDVDAKKIREAFEFAQKAHAGQTRMSGEPYITHPFAVTMILAEYGADEESIIAALLHDVVEDTEYTLSDIEKHFGKAVATIVDTLTKLPHATEVMHHHQIDSKIESIRKIFEVMQHDVRAIVIKLCDRLHNMETLVHFRPEKQKRIAQETLDIYVKIADRLSVADLKERLEEESMKYLYPAPFQLLQKLKASNHNTFKKAKKGIQDIIRTHPHLKKCTKVLFHSVVPYDRLIESHFETPEIQQEVHLLFEDEEDCYLGLKDVHSLWKNVRGNFRDYISLPKSNGYQALETVIINPDGNSMKFVIQTPRMYSYYRYGVMLECFTESKTGRKVQLPWVENLKRIHKETKFRSNDYKSALENDILKGSIIIYTHDNRIILLPPRSTALDAAFYDLGDRAFHLESVFINGRKKDFSTALQDSNTVNFEITNKETFEYDWIYKISTAYARSFISDRLRLLPSKMKQEIGRNVLQDELSHTQRGYLEELSDQRKKEVAKSFDLSNWEEVLEEIGIGSVSPGTVLELLYHEKKGHRDIKKYLLELHRDISKPISGVFEIFSQSNSSIDHLSTENMNGDGFHDSYMITASSKELRLLLSKLSSGYSITFISEYVPLRKMMLLYFLIGIVAAWSFNPFIIRYLIGEGLDPINISAIRMLAAGSAIYLISYWRRLIFQESYKAFRFNFSFWIITFFLTADMIFSHYALRYIPSSHFISVMESGHVFTFLFLSLYFSIKQGSKDIRHMILPTVLASSGIIFLFFLSVGTPYHVGHYLLLGVLTTFFLYSYLNSQYQKQQRVKDRTLIQLSYMFLIGAFFHLPIMDFQNLTSASGQSILWAVFNGVTAGALGHCIYFILTRYFKQFKINLGLSFILPIVVLVEYVLYGLADMRYLISFALIYMAVLLTAYAERRSKNAPSVTLNIPG